MFAIILIIINIVVSILGVYLFDYQVDEIINSPLVIVLSILAGTLVMLASFFIYIEVFYVLVAKRRPTTSRLKHILAKQIMTVPLVATNTQVKVVGKENLPSNTGFSIYSNHTSMMDVPVLMYKLNKHPVAFLAKKAVINLFAVGKWTPKLGCVMIDRSNARKGAESIINVIKNVKSGSTMVVFPEGTRSNEIGTLNEFKPGSFKVALKSKAPLVPITIVKQKNFKKVKWPLPKRITLVIHEPIPFSEYKGMASLELAEKVRKIISSSL
jgi:1-acyl-sn-glycerol-3-phosphate acyltransferase